MLMNGINTNTIYAFKADILDISEMQGGFDIVASHFLDFIAMTPSIEKNTTTKVSFVTRGGGGRRCGLGNDCRSGMPSEFDVQYAMHTIKNK